MVGKESFRRISVASTERQGLPESSRYIIKSGGPKSCAKLEVVTRTCTSSLASVTEKRRERERRRRERKGERTRERIYDGANEAQRIESRPNLRR